MVATTDQQARMFSLLIGVGELVRDGKRNAEDVLRVLQVIKEERKFAEILLAARQQSEPQLAVAVYPVVGEIFELTIDGDAPENQPLEMVRRDGYSGRWKHNGLVVQGVQTRRFKLVEIGYCSNWNEVIRKLAEHGKIPEGQWRQAYNAAYPQSDVKGPIGIADSAWVDPGGYARFSCIRTGGRSDFSWAARAFRVRWRWLVEVSK